MINTAASERYASMFMFKLMLVLKQVQVRFISLRWNGRWIGTSATVHVGTICER